MANQSLNVKFKQNGGFEKFSYLDTKKIDQRKFLCKVRISYITCCKLKQIYHATHVENIYYVSWVIFTQAIDDETQFLYRDKYDNIFPRHEPDLSFLEIESFFLLVF